MSKTLHYFCNDMSHGFEFNPVFAKVRQINKNFIYIIHILYIYYIFNLNLSHYHSYNRTYMHINVCNMQY